MVADARVWQSGDMHAITVDEPGGVDVMSWAEVPIPDPGPGEVLVRTQAAGVNRGDVLQRQGHYPPPAGITDIMGMEALGVIEKLGDGVEGHQVGEQVLALVSGGAYAEFFVVPAGQLLKLPAGIDPLAAAGLVEVAATVVSNFDRVHLSAGETVLIHGGAGGIGTLAINELPGKFVGCATAEEIDAVDSVSGATITSNALKEAVKAALAQAK